MPVTEKKGCAAKCCGGCGQNTSSTQCVYHQGVIMSGCGKPPGSCDFDGTITCSNTLGTGCVGLLDSMVPESDLCQPVQKDGSYPFMKGTGLSFLYENWIDTCNLTWYALKRSSTGCGGVPIGYNPVIVASDAAALDAALAAIHDRFNINNIPAVTAGNSFIFSYDLPVPSITALWLPSGRGETLTPPYVLTGSQYGYQVFARDSRNNRYYRDTYNSHCTEPQFPCNPCNTDCFVQELLVPSDAGSDHEVVSISYEFISQYCQWYLADPCDGSAVLPTENTAECPLACCWNRCGRKLGPNPKCTNAQNRDRCTPEKPSSNNCGCN
jgi:hypothetical protein